VIFITLLGYLHVYSFCQATTASSEHFQQNNDPENIKGIVSFVCGSTQIQLLLTNPCAATHWISRKFLEASIVMICYCT